MDYTPISPFMRPISHAHLCVSGEPNRLAASKPVSKWEILRELVTARDMLGVTERELTVLQALLSFYPENALGGNAEMVIFPSNKAICARLNGMPCSTMRRHLAQLVEAKLLIRRDSPNGKRYVRKDGDERVSFGFDLSPLHRRAEEIARAAETVRRAQNRVKRLREIVSLMRRDLAALAEFGEETKPGLGLWDQLRDTAALTARALRRKLSADDLITMHSELETLLDQARNIIDGIETEELVTNDARFEQHHHSSNKESIDFEPHLVGPKCADASNDESAVLDEGSDSVEGSASRRVPKIPLHLVVKTCPSIANFYQGEIRHWHQLYDAACRIHPAMGITPSAWEEAQRAMGPEQASIVVIAMLERFSEIRSPGGYLRALARKAVTGAFSCGPMVMALIGRRSPTST